MRIRWIILGVLTAGFAPGQQASSGITARQVIERIQKQSGVKWRAETVDTFKTGNPDAPVTGIATTFMATFDVLKRAAASGKNLIITHEPTFYNHLDETKAFEKDPVYAAKRAFIDEHKLVIWRFHDHWHMVEPDGINRGVVRALGWEKYQQPGRLPVFAVPETTVGQLAGAVRKQLGIRTLRVVGDSGMKVKKVALVPGAAPPFLHYQALGRSDVDVLLAGEVPEWETIAYVRDAAGEGRHKALILMGHVPSEEPGMEECARWLKTFVTEVPVEFIPAGEMFWSPK